MKASGLQHLSKRKRKTWKLNRKLGLFRSENKKFEVYPSNKFWIDFLDKSLVFIAIIGPLTTFPQIWKIFSLKSAAGISILSWGSWAILDLPWILYGFIHKDKPIIVAYILWFITNLVVVIGAILYS